jgi:hypothetical protein
MVRVTWLRRRSHGHHADAWSFYASLGDDPRRNLTKKQQEVAAICDLRQEVNSGGFDSYFRYWGGNTAPEALAALEHVLGQDWVDVLSAAMSLLGADYPTDVDDREERLEAPGVQEALGNLDRRYYDLESASDADRLLSEYLARRP